MTEPERDEECEGYDRAPTYTQIPNIVLDRYMARLTDPELRVLLYIMRRSYGWQHRTDAEVAISIAEMAKGAKDGSDKGAGLSASSAKRGVRGLLEKGHIVRSRQYGKETAAYEANSYRLRLKGMPKDVGLAPIGHPDPSVILTHGPERTMGQDAEAPLGQIDPTQIKKENEKKGSPSEIPPVVPPPAPAILAEDDGGQPLFVEPVVQDAGPGSEPAPSVVLCPACQAENPVGQRQCDYCENPLPRRPRRRAATRPKVAAEEASVPPKPEEQVWAAFEWAVRERGRNPNHYDFTKTRRELVAKRREQFSDADLLDAVRGWLYDRHYTGDNDSQTVYGLQFELILDVSKRRNNVERFRNLWRERQGQPYPFQEPTTVVVVRNGRRPDRFDRSAAAGEASTARAQAMRRAAAAGRRHEDWPDFATPEEAMVIEASEAMNRTGGVT